MLAAAFGGGLFLAAGYIAAPRRRLLRRSRQTAPQEARKRGGTACRIPRLVRSSEIFFCRFRARSERLPTEVASQFFATPHLLFSPLCGMLPSARKSASGHL